MSLQCFAKDTSGGQWWQIEQAIDASPTEPPVVINAEVGADGLTFTLTFNRVVQFGAGGNGGLTISPSGGAATLTYASGAGTSSLVYTISREILAGETLTTSYVQPGNGIEDLANVDLVSFAGRAVTNDSALVAIALTGIAVGTTGNTITLSFNRTAVFGAGGNGGLAVTGSIGAATPTYASGSGTTSLTYNLSRTIYVGETVTATYTQPGNGIEDTGGHDLASFSNQSATNNSTDNTVRLFWSTATDTPELGTAPPVSQLAAQYFGAAAMAANPNDGNRVYLHIPNTQFPAAYWYNNTNTDVWGATTGKGQVQFTWMYTSTYTNGSLTYQLTAKSTNPIFDGNEGMALRTKINGGNNGMGGFSSAACDVLWPTSPAQAVKHTVIQRWNNLTSNPTNTRTMVVYLLQNTGDRASQYVTTTVAAPTQPVWHHFLPGNDTVTTLEQWDTDFIISDDWSYDFPINLWQDFNFTTVDQASLEANDHNATAVWLLAGTTTRFTTNVLAQHTNPSTINLWTDTSTRGLRNDLTATAIGTIGTSFTATAGAICYGHWVKFSALTAGTVAPVSLATDGSNTIIGLVARNNGGQHQLYIRNDAFTLSGFIDVSPDTWYWVTIKAQRNTSSLLRVYDTNGTQVGTEVNVVASNNSISSVRIGSLQTTTAQSAGKVIDYAHLVYEPFRLYPIMPWDN